MPDLADPWFLILLPAPLLVHFMMTSADRTGAVMVVPEGVGRGIMAQVRHGHGARPGRYILPALVWAMLVLALAGPRILLPASALPLSGRDLVVALDLSGSMVREDFAVDGEAVSRLDAVKKVGAAFVRGRGGDRVSLVVFGSQAYVAAPPGFDVEAVARTIEGLVIGISGRATNIGDALGLALKRLSGSEATSRVVVLLSDGANNAGSASPRDVALLARDRGVRVHTIALGPKSVAEAPNERGVVDAATLKSISELSGGETFRVRTLEDLQTVADAIDRLEPTDRAGLAAETYRDLWPYPAGLAGLGCLVIGWRRSR